jgi:cysteine desulfurase
LHAFAQAAAEVWGNPSSIHHHGQQARARLEQARAQVAALLGCDAKAIVFTSGGTESDNLAILGAVRADARARKHVITTAAEHPAVLQACARLELEGCEVTYLAVDSRGLVDPENLRRQMRPHTVLASIQHANNETGVIQPLAELAAIAREAGVQFHSDGVQAAGKIPVDVRALDVDLYSISGHKIYAPKGSGALYVRPGVTLQPSQFGGRHEGGLRAGTENVPGAVALGAAASLAATPPAELAALLDRLERGIVERVPSVRVNSAGAPRVPNTTNIAFEGIDGEALLIALDLKGFAVSTGAACSSGAVAPSHVLTAMGLSKEAAKSSIRFSLGRANTAEQVDALIAAVRECAARLRSLSPRAPAASLVRDSHA